MIYVYFIVTRKMLLILFCFMTRKIVQIVEGDLQDINY